MKLWQIQLQFSLCTQQFFFHQWHIKWKKKGDLEKFRKGTGISIIIVVIAAVVVSYINTMIVIQSIVRVALVLKRTVTWGLKPQ